MTAELVAFTQHEFKWSRPENPLFVGKDVLELLSTSMYVDPMSMYREYIQNSADAIDVACSAGLLNAPGRVEILIEPATRTVLIRDEGVGLGREQFVHQLTALGGSKKRGTGARGFRGVGRLAGLAFCQEVVFRSRQGGENTVHELRWDARAVKSLLRSSDNSCDLSEIVTKTIATREAAGVDRPPRFFEVELHGIVRHRDDRLLNEESVAKYLAQVAPVPFSPDFQFADQIRSFLESHGIRLGLIDIEIAGHGLLHRPHRNSIPMGKSGDTRFQELTTIYTPGRDGNVAAATWILHHDYPGALPASSSIDGWRLRCGDIQVGDNCLLQALFPEPRFNSWCVAETHVLDPRIIPNGRRDHFEQNAYYFDLANHLAPHAREIAQRCRNSSIARNLVRSVEESLTESRQNLKVLEKGIIADNAASKLISKLERTFDHLDAICARGSISIDQRVRYEREIKRLRRRLFRFDASHRREGLLLNFAPNQRALLVEVFNTIYQSTDDLHKAQRLIDRIVSSLSRKRTSRKKADKPKRRKRPIRRIAE